MGRATADVGSKAQALGFCMKRIRGAEDAIKPQTADFQPIYDYFVKTYGEPKTATSDATYLTMIYDHTITGDDGKRKSLPVTYKLHFEKSESTALFGIVHSVSDPFLMGECTYTEVSPPSR